MKSVEAIVSHQKVGELFYTPATKEYGFNYTIEQSQPVSLIMPYQKATYRWHYRLHPIFEMHLPEGYLFEIFKNHLSKTFGYIDDFLIFSYLAPNIEGRVTFQSQFAQEFFEDLEIQEVLQNDTPDTFNKLLQHFLHKNAISGVQPKTLALLRDKESLVCKEYIIKTWGEEYPYLAQNEYFCLKAVERAGVSIPTIELSYNNRFLLVEKFTKDKKSQEFLGFEEVLGLMGLNREDKYSGSYEKVAKVIYAVTTDKADSMKRFYKTVVMNYLLKNGDAHLKNFGILYDNDFKRITFAPAYDIVNTVVYIFQDKPALMMQGKKVWYGKKELIAFGIEHCYLSSKDAHNCFEACQEAVERTKEELKAYIKNEPTFATIGNRMIESWSLDNQQTYKEIPIELRRNWAKD